MKKIFFSIIIPFKEPEEFLLRRTIPAIFSQTFSWWELILLPDKKDKKGKLPGRVFPTGVGSTPGEKRNLGAQKAKGEVLAFIDSDAYPSKRWLENAAAYFSGRKRGFSLAKIAAVCGPGVTPESDGVLEQVSGWMWTSWLGSAGAGRYRCWPGRKREVDDYPSFNLLVRKKDFFAVGGFDSFFWPGEDTKLCHDLVYKLGKKIVYDPKILVYHHRRKVFLPHLKQIGRYGFQRGYFVKILPKTSRRWGYFVPSLFSLSVLLIPFIFFFLKMIGLTVWGYFLIRLYFFVLGLYGVLLLLTAFWVFWQSKNLLIAFLMVPTIFVSHLFYGIMFLRGLTKKRSENKLK